MKTALICLVAGFGLAHVASFVTDANASNTEPAATSTHPAFTANAAMQNVFSQYDVPPPQTVTIASVSTGGSPDHASHPQTLASGSVDAVFTTTSMMSPANPEIAANVARGVSQLDQAMKTAPVAMARMSESVIENGIIAALAYDDPAVKAETAKLSAQIGDSLRNFAEAIAKDMQRSIRESGIQTQSASAR